MTAYACRIKEGNFKAIASEKPGFNLDETISWLAAHDDGYFVRDDNSPWDCEYMPILVFDQIYQFVHGDNASMFREITMS